MSALTLRRTEEVMTRSLHTIDESERLVTAARLMSEKRIHALFVPGARPGESLGVISLKDIVQILAHEEVEALAAMTVADVVIRPVITVPASMSIRECLRLMRMTGIRRAPVLKNDEVIGIISSSDILRAILADPAVAS